MVLGAGAAGARAGSSLDGPGVHVVENPDWATGMASSLRVGVAAALDLVPARVVVAHVDQPGVGPDDVARLLAAHRPGRVTASRWLAAAEGAAGRAVLAGRTRSSSTPRSRTRRRERPRRPRARDFLRAHADLVDVVDHSGDGRDLDTAADLDLLDPPPRPAECGRQSRRPTSDATVSRTQRVG